MARVAVQRIGACLVAASVCAAACGGSSGAATAPSPAGIASVAGSWSGTLTFNGTLPQGPIALTLTQAPGASTVTGTWSGKNEWSGTIDGSISGSTFAGQLLWNYTTATQGLSKCSATVSLLGNAGGNAITWTSASITRGAGSVFCDLGVSSFRIDATK